MEDSNCHLEEELNYIWNMTSTQERIEKRVSNGWRCYSPSEMEVYKDNKISCKSIDNSRKELDSCLAEMNMKFAKTKEDFEYWAKESFKILEEIYIETIEDLNKILSPKSNN